jgi:protein TonB
MYSERHGVTGNLLAQFVVDTNGRAVMSTFKDLWPSDKPRLTGGLQEYYEAFVDAVREGVSDETFTPARVGSCAVRQIVQMPVMFVPPKGSHRASQ